LDSSDADDAAHWVTARALFVSLYVFSLRGNEGLLLDLKGLREEYKAGCSHDPPFSTQALLGPFKGEQHHRQHLMYSVHMTSSGIQVCKVLSDLILVRQHQNLVDGPAICDKEGSQWTTAMANKILHELLCCLYDQNARACSHPTLVPR
jgi:hypothetical protein